MGQFLLMLQSDRTNFDNKSADEQKAQIARYNDWVGGLVEKNIFKNGLGLQKGHYTIKPDNKLTVDGPFTEAKEVLTGFFQIEADNVEEAIKIGKTCPALSCGETVMVFQVGGSGN